MLIFIKNFGMKIQRLILTYILILNFVANGYTQNVIELAKNKLVQDPVLQNASIGIAVYDLETKEKITSHNDLISMSCASTAKLFSTASAIEILGLDYQPKTRLYSENKINSDGTLKGNLWIRGGGDVSLGSKFYNKEGEEMDFLKKWADSLYSLGLRKIEGAIIGDASEFGYQGVPDGWIWSDMGNYYGAPSSGLSIFDNILKCYFFVGRRVGDNATLIKTFPEIENLNFNNSIVGANIKGDDSNIYGGPFSYDRFATGYLPKNSSSFMVRSTLPDPELQFAEALKKVLEEKNIQITGNAKGVRNMSIPPASNRYSELYLIYSHEGRDLKSIAKWTNMRSVNLFAEQLISWIAYEKTGFGDTKTAVNYIKRYWSNKIYSEGMFLKDGSGLSRNNALNASNFCSLLMYMFESKNFNDFYETLPITGESGTLSSVCFKQAAHGKIRAKSGTLNKVKSYSGYVTTNNGKKLAFSLMINHFSCTNSEMLKKIEQFMNAMVQY
jgi:serine-type D-Ala-D-Ala carboxypeptidase/endopeptidase (penicillin-binding protein 4)